VSVSETVGCGPVRSGCLPCVGASGFATASLTAQPVRSGCLRICDGEFDGCATPLPWEKEYSEVGVRLGLYSS
jgi:hypothetical protein